MFVYARVCVSLCVSVTVCLVHHLLFSEKLHGGFLLLYFLGLAFILLFQTLWLSSACCVLRAVVGTVLCVVGVYGCVCYRVCLCEFLCVSWVSLSSCCRRLVSYV